MLTRTSPWTSYVAPFLAALYGKETGRDVPVQRQRPRGRCLDTRSVGGKPQRGPRHHQLGGGALGRLQVLLPHVGVPEPMPVLTFPSGTVSTRASSFSSAKSSLPVPSMCRPPGPVQENITRAVLAWSAARTTPGRAHPSATTHRARRGKRMSRTSRKQRQLGLSVSLRERRAARIPWCRCHSYEQGHRRAQAVRKRRGLTGGATSGRPSYDKLGRLVTAQGPSALLGADLTSPKPRQCRSWRHRGERIPVVRHRARPPRAGGPGPERTGRRTTSSRPRPARPRR